MRAARSRWAPRLARSLPLHNYMGESSGQVGEPSYSSAMSKSAVDKRDHAPAPHVEVLEAAKGPLYPAGRMLVASPLEVQAVVLLVPEGRVLRLTDLRATLAARFRADYACAMTTGLFLRIVAEAAWEERGRKGAMVPTWRVVCDDGELLDKLPGGPAAQAAQLEADGVAVLHLGKRIMVANVEHYAWVPPAQRRKNAAEVPAASGKREPGGKHASAPSSDRSPKHAAPAASRSRPR